MKKFALVNPDTHAIEQVLSGDVRTMPNMHEIPSDLVGKPADDLYFDGANIREAKVVTTWFVDDDGNRFPKKRPGLHEIKGRILPGQAPKKDKKTGKWQIETEDDLFAELVKGECATRIEAVASKAAQLNMIAAVATGDTAAADTLAAFQTWVGKMRAKSSDLVKKKSATYAKDTNWPKPPASLVDAVDAY